MRYTIVTATYSALLSIFTGVIRHGAAPWHTLNGYKETASEVLFEYVVHYGTVLRTQRFTVDERYLPVVQDIRAEAEKRIAAYTQRLLDQVEYVESSGRTDAV